MAKLLVLSNIVFNFLKFKILFHTKNWLTETYSYQDDESIITFWYRCFVYYHRIKEKIHRRAILDKEQVLP